MERFQPRNRNQGRTRKKEQLAQQEATTKYERGRVGQKFIFNQAI
jgi:hypothetical protein